MIATCKSQVDNKQADFVLVIIFLLYAIGSGRLDHSQYFNCVQNEIVYCFRLTLILCNNSKALSLCRTLLLIKGWLKWHCIFSSHRYTDLQPEHDPHTKAWMVTITTSEAG